MLQFAGSCLAVLLAVATSASAQVYDIDFSLQPATRPSTGGSRYTRSAEAEIRFQEGLLHYRAKRVAEAEGDFNAVLSTDPGDAQAYYYLGLSQLDLQRPQDALKSFDQALRLDASLLEVHDPRATANIRLGNYDEAEKDINALINPRFEVARHYLRGQLAYAKGDTATAQREFAISKRMGGPEAPAARMYEGLTYLRMRELVKARSTFRESAIIDADRDPTLAAASRQLDAVLALQQRPEKRWEGQITLGYEWDSNVIQLGSNIPVPAGISDQSDFRLLFQPRGSYSFVQNDTTEVGIEGNGYFSWQQDLSAFDIQSYQLGPFINYKLRENLYASARYGFNYVQLGRDPFLTRHIITPQLTYVEKNFGYTSAFYQFQTRDFNDDTGDSPLDRSGRVHTIGVVQGINLPPIFRDAGEANLELSYRFEDQIADGSDFDAKLHTLGATLYTPLPFWKLRADLGVNIGIDRYDNPNSLDSSGDRRKDFEFNVAAGLTRQITKDIAVRLDYSYTDHNSNVEFGTQSPYEFERHQVGIRLIWSF